MPFPRADIAAIKRSMAGDSTKVTPRMLWDSLANTPHPAIPPGLFEAANAQLSPLFDIGGEQSPLTNRIFGGAENFGTRAVDTALKVAPLATTILGGAGASAGMKALGLGETLASDLAVGGVSGAMGGATQAAVNEQPLAPSAVMGGLLGAGMGAGVWSLSRAGRSLATAYAARPGRLSFPDIHELDQAIPAISLERTEIEARGAAARGAWRKLIPIDSPELKRTNPVLWSRARAEAAAAAHKAALTAAPDGEVLAAGEAASTATTRAFRIPNDKLRRNSLDAVKTLWRRYITRMQGTLMRDPEFGAYGTEIANVINRIEQLSDHLEGSLHTNVLTPLWSGVQDDPKLIDAFLHGEGGQLSPAGMAVAKRWRELASAGFDQMKSVKLMEEVRADHPAVSGGQQDLFPDMPTAAHDTWKIVPIQERTNYVPYYRDPRQIARLLKKGTPERNAYIQKIIGNGDAENITKAGELLDNMLSNDAHFTPMHIRTGPFQHERELTYGLPRERDAKIWMARWSHDYARRVASAKVVGGQDEAINEILTHMRKDGLSSGAGRVETLWRNYVGRPDREIAQVMPLARTARAAVAVELLTPRVGVLQALQIANAAGRMGIRGTLEGIAAEMRNPILRQAADEVGALLPSQHMLASEEPLAALGSWWVKDVAQMQRADRVPRVFSALTGGVYAKRWAKEYFELAAKAAESQPRGGVGAALKYVGIRNPAERLQILQHRLEGVLGIPIEHIMETQGELPIESVLAAMRNASHDTQFSSSILKLPEARHTTQIGQFMYMLRTFSKQQTSFINNLLADARRGDTGPLVRYVLTYPALYAAVKPVLDFIGVKDAQDEADQELVDRAWNTVQGAITTGMFGGMGDFINQMAASDPGRFASYVAGPAIGNALGLVSQDIPQAVQGNFDPLLHRIEPRAVRTARLWTSKLLGIGE